MSRKKAKYLLPLFAFFFACCQLTSKKQDPVGTIKSSKLYFELQLVNSSNYEMIKIIDSLFIYFYEDFTAYQIHIPHTFSTTRTGERGEIISGEPFRTDVDIQYYIFRKGDSLGLRFDSVKTIHPASVKYDSFILKRNILSGLNLFDERNDSFYRKEPRGDTLIEIFIPKKKIDSSYCDTTCFYFVNSKNTCDFSFSNELEKEKGKELVKVQLFFNNYTGPAIQKKPSGRMFEFKRIDTVVNAQDIIKLAKKYKSFYKPK